MQVRLVDVVIFRADVKFVSLFFWKVHASHACVLLVLTLNHLIAGEQVEANFRVAQFVEIPETHFTIVRDRNDVVGVLRAYNRQRVNWEVMAISCQIAFLYRSGLLRDIPLDDVARQSCPDHDIGLERVKYSLAHFVLTT